MKLKIFVILAAIISALALALGSWMFFNAREQGDLIGANTGKVTGWAVGSFRGVTEGIEKGTEAGKASGLSAEDTQVETIRKIEEIGRLEVLAAGAKLTNIHSIGTDYSAIYLMKGNAVFTVDLQKADFRFEEEGKTLSITLPEPEMELYIDESATEKLAEYQKHFYTGSAKDGFTAYLNTTKNTVAEVRETMANYDELLTQAKESAVKQVTWLAQSARGEETAVTVRFMDERQAENGK